MKAFLAHSSKDKEFVAAVAKELGRQFCVYDEYSFDNSTQLRDAILRGLGDSSLFVLFASNEALKSAWVNFETEEAWERHLHRVISAGVAYILSSSVTSNDIPKWLAKTLAVRQNSPRVIARDIRARIDEMIRTKTHPVFVGRHAELDAAEAALTPTDGTRPPRALAISGLSGIGRRSLLRQMVPRLLSLRKGVEFQVSDAESINDICTIVANEVEPYSTKEGLDRLVREIENLSEADALLRTMSNLQRMVDAGEYPVFVDSGGLLDADGNVSAPMRAILQLLDAYQGLYVFLVFERRPTGGLPDSVPHITVQPLLTDEVKRLLSALAAKENVPLSPAQLGELAKYVAGYPPAAAFAVHQAKHYGVQVVMADKSRLVQFRTSAFLKYLERVFLSETEKELLVLLAFYSPLPLPVLSETLEETEGVLATSLAKLIDLSLVVSESGSMYGIAAPVTQAVSTAYGLPDTPVHCRLAKSLDAILTDETELGDRFLLSRLLFLAASMSRDRELADRTVHLATDLISFAVKLYHKREYDYAARAARAALDKRPRSVEARTYLIKALIQEDQWEEAHNEIVRLEPYAKHADLLYLAGFLNRKRGFHARAVTDFTKALELGRRGAAVHRELAQCYLHLNDLDLAAKAIAEALKRSSDNGFIIDLAAKIAMRRSKQEETERLLDQLEKLAPPLYEYRRSRLLSGRRLWVDAEAAAKRALESEANPPFHVRAQLVLCTMFADHMEEAERLLGILDGQLPGRFEDIRLGLRCRLEIIRGNFARALELSATFRDKSKDVHKALRRDALSGELSTSALTDELRLQYETERNTLAAELNNKDAGTLVAEQLDEVD